MGKVTTVTCDSCHKDISQSNYQTVFIRRYTGYKHEKKISYPAIWLCDDCYRKLSMYMMLPMEKEAERGYRDAIDDSFDELKENEDET